MRDNMIFNHL